MVPGELHMTKRTVCTPDKYQADYESGLSSKEAGDLSCFCVHGLIQ